MMILLNGSSAVSVYFTIFISCNYLALCRHQLTRSHTAWSLPTVLSEYEPFGFCLSIHLPSESESTPLQAEHQRPDRSQWRLSQPVCTQAEDNC